MLTSDRDDDVREAAEASLLKTSDEDLLPLAPDRKANGQRGQ